MFYLLHGFHYAACTSSPLKTLDLTFYMTDANNLEHSRNYQSAKATFYKRNQ